MKGEVKHKNKNRKGEIIDSDWLHKAKHRKVLDYSNLVAVEWDDGGLGWVNKKLLEEI